MSRLSFAARVRGWHDDATALEQRLKDFETFERSHRRRWAIAGALFVIGMLGSVTGMIPVRFGTVVLVAGGGAVLNALIGLINERGWYRWWFIYMLPLMDVVLVNVLVVWFGHGGVIAALFIAVLPYAFDQGQAVGDFLVLVGSLAYLVASWLHGQLYPGSSGLDATAYLETGVFIANVRKLAEYLELAK